MPIKLEPFDVNFGLQRSIGTPDVAEWLGVSDDIVERLAQSGQIPGREIEGAWTFGVAALNLWLEGQSLETCLRKALAANTVNNSDGQIKFALDPLPTLATIEAACIRHVLDSGLGNKIRAAEILGLDPSTLYRKLARTDGSTP